MFKLRIDEENLSMLFGAMVIVLMGGLIVNYFSSNKYKLNILSPENDEIVSKIVDLNKRVSSLESLPVSSSSSILANKIIDLEKQQDIIYKTVTVDPDKALTATVLRNEQKSIQEKVDEVRIDQKNLNDRLNNLILTLFASIGLPIALYFGKRILFSGSK